MGGFFVYYRHSYAHIVLLITKISESLNGGKRGQQMTKKATKKGLNMKAVIGVITLVAVIAAMGILYSVFREKPVTGSKEISIEVVNDKKESTVYELNTDAEYLRQAMEEAQKKGLSFSGTESEYGLMIDTVNGVTADYTKDGAYWGFFVNDAYCNYGIDTQPVNDGDAFKIEYVKQ